MHHLKMAGLLVGIAACGFALTAGVAFATTIDGSAVFFFSGGVTNNLWDPAEGYVPAGFGNSVSPLAVPVGAGIEFGLDDTFNRDTANFTSTSLVITDVCLQQGGVCDINNAFKMTFAASTPGFFNGIILTTDTFTGGVTFSVLADILTVNWAGHEVDGTAAATFTFGAAETPLPAAFPLFATGLGALDLLGWRRKRKQAA